MKKTIAILLCLFLAAPVWANGNHDHGLKLGHSKPPATAVGSDPVGSSEQPSGGRKRSKVGYLLFGLGLYGVYKFGPNSGHEGVKLSIKARESQ